jgi:MraZ protein
MARSGEKWWKVGNTPNEAAPQALTADPTRDHHLAESSSHHDWGSTTVFTGEYRHSVDDKGRIAVPARFRTQLDTGAYVSRWMESCLAIHTSAGWESLAEKMAALPITDTNGRRFSRFVFSGATPAEMDRQGRVLLPAYLREEIGLTTEAVVVGARDHAEIWAPARWDDYQGGLDDPDALALAFEGLGI